MRIKVFQLKRKESIYLIKGKFKYLNKEKKKKKPR